MQSVRVRMLVSDPGQLQTSSLFGDARLSTRCFLRLRSALTPYEVIAATLPSRGRLLDLGSGHGLLSFTLALGSPEREIVGIDHDVERVRLARTAALRLPRDKRPRFEVADLRESSAALESATLAGIAMIDILHYFDPASQQSLIAAASRALIPGGILVVREIDADAGIRAAVNRLYERFATGVGFTRSTGRKLTFRGAREWTAMLESAGFSTRLQSAGPRFLADVLFIARRNL